MAKFVMWCCGIRRCCEKYYKDMTYEEIMEKCPRWGFLTFSAPELFGWTKPPICPEASYPEKQSNCRCRGFCNCRGCLRVEWEPEKPLTSPEEVSTFANHVLNCTGGYIKDVLEAYDNEVWKPSAWYCVCQQWLYILTYPENLALRFYMTMLH